VVGGVLRVADRGWPEVRLWDDTSESDATPRSQFRTCNHLRNMRDARE